MAKYLQDLYIHAPSPPFHFSKAEEKSFYADNGYLWSSLSLIENLYNYNFPVKYKTADNLWRLFICSSTDSKLDLSKEGFENWFYADLEHLKSLDATTRKKYLFHKVADQIIQFCKKMNYSFHEFEAVNKLIADKNILFDEPHKKEKLSPDRRYKAFIWRKYDEFENATYLKIADKAGKTILFSKIADLHFCHFNKIVWADNETILFYKIKENGGSKAAGDFYSVKLNGSVKFVPQTREGLYDYGVELMSKSATFEKGLEYIREADKMGHGKANNILLNLKNNSAEKNITVLNRQPGNKRNRIV